MLRKSHSIRSLWFLLFIYLFFAAGYCIRKVLILGAAYNAKILCTNTFLSLRNPVHIQQSDLNGLESLLRNAVDFKERSVVSGLPGIPQQKAIYLDIPGCILLAGSDAAKIRKRYTHNNAELYPKFRKELFIPRVEKNGFYWPKLKAVIDKLFVENNTPDKQQTRAVLVIHKGILSAEQYAPGFSSTMPLLGWSMTKSIINAIVGVLVKHNKLQLYQPVAVGEWSDSNDPRSHITLDQLLRMSSGLQFNESQNPIFSDVTAMLFQNQNSFTYAAAKPLKNQPDTKWQYSSGTTNIITGIIRNTLGGSTIDVIAFIEQQLFAPLSITQATIEADASGNLVGSSFMYATAREWLVLGQLYLQDGVWDSKRILPQGWVSYSTTPTKTAPNGQYAAHFWTNGGRYSNTATRPFPELPGDMFYAAGYKGQRLIMLPDAQLVILHMGWFDDYSDRHMRELITHILASRDL